jgi:hypothetical protein
MSFRELAVSRKLDEAQDGGWTFSRLRPWKSSELQRRNEYIYRVGSACQRTSKLWNVSLQGGFSGKKMQRRGAGNSVYSLVSESVVCAGRVADERHERFTVHLEATCRRRIEALVS